MDIQETLRELEEILEQERKALRTLDMAVIDAAAERKRELDKSLNDLVAEGRGPSVADAPVLERVVAVAKENQLLLVHARACVRGALALLTGNQPDGYHPSATPAVPARVDIRG